MRLKKNVSNFNNPSEQKDNKKRTSRSFSILSSDLGSSERARRAFLVLYREIVESIDQKHENAFFSCSLSEMDLLTS